MGISSSAVIAAALGVFGSTAFAAATDCSMDRVSISGDFGRANFTVSVADDPQERATGLMNVPEMPTMTGMVFVYSDPIHATFWMKDTLIPLDMIFAGPDGVIRSIQSDAVPMDETTIDGGQGIQVVLEINGGLSDRLGIKVGDVLQHPSFGAQAAAPCN